MAIETCWELPVTLLESLLDVLVDIKAITEVVVDDTTGRPRTKEVIYNSHATAIKMLIYSSTFSTNGEIHWQALERSKISTHPI